MYFKQMFLNCLAQYSYILGSKGEAVIIDPKRDIKDYIDLLKDNNLTLKYIIETHTHADFVSGHIALSKAAGAPIVCSKNSKAKFEHIEACDNDVFQIGDVKLTILETPGHTLDSICVLAKENDSQEQLLFTGDTLFLGDVGRPDLACDSDHKLQDMAQMQYNSIFKKVLKLSDDTLIYPGHGAGSLCGKNICHGNFSTIGQEKTKNSLLQLDENQFIEALCSNLPNIPNYFIVAAGKNQTIVDDIKELKNLNKTENLDEINIQNSILLDVRDCEEYNLNHIKDSINISLNGQFASWAGSILPHDKKIYLIANNLDNINEAIVRLSRVGLDNVWGYYFFDANDTTHLTTTKTITIEQFHKLSSSNKISILDVRNKSECEKFSIPNSLNIPLIELQYRLKELENEHFSDATVYVICGSGYRSTIAISLLHNIKTLNHLKFINVQSGATGYKKYLEQLVKS